MTNGKGRDLALWTAVFAGPFLWLCSFEAKFALVPWACTFGQKLALYLVALAAFVLIACSGALALREWRALGSKESGEEGGAVARSRFMALGGLVFSSGFCLVVLAQAIPDLMLASCQ